MTLVAVSVGAPSKPGVETGIGSMSSPLPSPFSAAPVDARLPGTARSSTTRGGDRVGDARASHLGCDLLRRRAHADAVDRAVAGIGADDDGKSSTCGRAPSTTLVNRNALRSCSSMPPTYCQRTSGCSSASLSIGAVDRAAAARACAARRDARAGRRSRERLAGDGRPRRRGTGVFVKNACQPSTVAYRRNGKRRQIIPVSPRAARCVAIRRR